MRYVELGSQLIPADSYALGQRLCMQSEQLPYQRDSEERAWFPRLRSVRLACTD